MLKVSEGLNDALASVDLIVVGAGFYGLTIAERAASQLGARVGIIEKRDHLGGNAYSYVDPASGIEIHKYGSHLFHTSNRRVWDYCSKFTQFTSYKHTVWTVHNGMIYSLPINLGTMSAFFGRYLSPDEARRLIASESESFRDFANPESFEECAIRSVGPSLYRAFIRGYTQKQWQTDPRQLPADIFTRLPVRFNFDNSYFSDTWQGLPVDGYAAWLHAMASHELISIFLETDYFKLRNAAALLQKPIVYSGPIDQFHDYRFGRLEWRTLDFELKHLETSNHQGTAVMNFADEDVPYTRVHEFRHLHPERDVMKQQTVIAYEYSRLAGQEDEPYYPIRTRTNMSSLKHYREACKTHKNVTFGGRLGSYQYLDMHMAIGSALADFESEVISRLRRSQDVKS